MRKIFFDRNCKFLQVIELFFKEIRPTKIIQVIAKHFMKTCKILWKHCKIYPGVMKNLPKTLRERTFKISQNLDLILENIGISSHILSVSC